MFDRFTVRAFRALSYANREVSKLGSSAIEPEHILLGVLAEGRGLGCRILSRTDDGLDGIRNDIIGRLTGRERASETNAIPFSASVKRAIGYAVEESERLMHDSVGTEHLLLGLLRDGRSVAAEVLVARGLTLDAVREAIIELLSRGEQSDPPGPPSRPANTYKVPEIPFVPSRLVHILHSGMRWPEQPFTSFTRSGFNAYGFTLEDIIICAWQGTRGRVDITHELRDDARFDFLMVLPQQETRATCLGLLQAAIERHFAVHVTRGKRMRDVYRLTNASALGPILRRYPDPPPGTGMATQAFSVFARRGTDAPMFPLEPFAVHSVLFGLLATWFEEILGAPIIDETNLPGIYGFEFKERVNTPEAFIEILREQAGLSIIKERREIPMLIVEAAEARMETHEPGGHGPV